MNLQTKLFFLILLGIAIFSFYFNIKMHNLLRRYVGRWNTFIIAMTVNNDKKKIPENEWERYKKYRRKLFLVFLGGIALIFLLLILDLRFHVFGKNSK